ncbi:MAG: rRNA maturation RNase YbeY [Verrucomicrobia bacterium]|nr:rRNA maturation RNase YbeY [Verrucomicrobiota bacterium]
MRKLVRHHLEAQLGLPSYALGIHLLTPRQMARANERHLRHSGPTDVITFDYATPGEGALHGELLVCPAVAIEQARAYGTSWESELVRYIIHGVLHLRGFDDRTAAARRVMKREEDRWLRALVRTHSLHRLRAPVQTTRKRLLE